jgi:hypothetical protein
VKDVGHRVPVAGERLLRLLLRREGGFVFHGGNYVVERGVIALDAVGSLHRPCESHPPQGPRPAARLSHSISQPLPLVREEGENLEFVFVQFRRLKNHDICKKQRLECNDIE